MARSSEFEPTALLVWEYSATYRPREGTTQANKEVYEYLVEFMQGRVIMRKNLEAHLLAEGKNPTYTRYMLKNNVLVRAPEGSSETGAVEQEPVQERLAALKARLAEVEAENKKLAAASRKPAPSRSRKTVAKK